MWRITVDWLPGGDESNAKPLAHARICNLKHHERGSPVADLHAYFEAHEVPMATNSPPYLPDDPRRSLNHLVGDCILEDYPRFEGSVWDLIATALTASGCGWPSNPAEAHVETEA